MSDLTNAIKQICEEKGLSYEAVIATIESALAAAYRKDYGKKNQNIQVEFDPETTKSKVFDVKTVVEDLPEEEDIEEDPVEADKLEIDAKEQKKTKEKVETIAKSPDKTKGEKDKDEKDKKIDDDQEKASEEDEEEERKFNPKTDMQLSDAKLIKKTAKIEDEMKIKLEVPDEYGRMAAQTAKQVIIQRLREAEREIIFSEFKGKEKEVVSGVVQRREGRIVLVDLGKAVGVILQEDQIVGENYRPGERIKVYVREVNSKPKGPEILLSRTSDEILKKIFYLEIPEVSNGLIEIKSVAREAGFRSKVAVWTDSDNVDPIGSCVGQRGARIQTIIAELGGEKVDIIEYDENQVKFISNALSPAKILGIETKKDSNQAQVIVSADQLSLAIGKGGQNARLAAKLTGWKIDIVERKEESGSLKVQKKDDLSAGSGQGNEGAEDKGDSTRKKQSNKDDKQKEKKNSAKKSKGGKDTKKESRQALENDESAEDIEDKGDRKEKPKKDQNIEAKDDKNKEKKAKTDKKESGEKKNKKEKAD